MRSTQRIATLPDNREASVPHFPRLSARVGSCSFTGWRSSSSCLSLKSSRSYSKNARYAGALRPFSSSETSATQPFSIAKSYTRHTSQGRSFSGESEETIMHIIARLFSVLVMFPFAPSLALGKAFKFRKQFAVRQYTIVILSCHRPITAF